MQRHPWQHYMVTDCTGMVRSLFKMADQQGRSKRGDCRPSGWRLSPFHEWDRHRPCRSQSLLDMEPLRAVRTPLGDRRVSARRGWAGEKRAFFNRLLMVCLLAIGLWQVGEGSWIYAKAGLAQLLLQRAWSRSLAGEVAAKPWPWADTWPIARLVVPGLGIDQIVLEGAYGRTLAFGPGYVESTGPLEDAGSIILTGHRDTHFRFLEQLQPGETIRLQDNRGRWTQFTVQDRQVVDSRTATISTDERGTQLVLVTCYPFNAIVPGGPLRYVVTAAKE